MMSILFITSCNSRPLNGTTPFSRAVGTNRRLYSQRLSQPTAFAPFLSLSARPTALLPWPRPQSPRLYGICSASVPLAHAYGALYDLPKTIPASRRIHVSKLVLISPAVWPTITNIQTRRQTKRQTDKQTRITPNIVPYIRFLCRNSRNEKAKWSDN